MPDDHEIRIKCAEDFKEIRGMLGRIANDKEHDRAAFSKLTDVVEQSITENRSWHDESVRQLAAYNTQVVTLNGNMAERMVSVEAKSASAHHRLDNFIEDTRLKFKDIASILRGVAITVIATIIVIGVVAIFKYAANEQEHLNSNSTATSTNNGS